MSVRSFFLLAGAFLLSVVAGGAAESNDDPSMHIGPLKIFEGGRHGNEKVTFGHDLVVSEEEKIRQGVVILGDAFIDGQVSGDLVVVLGNVKLGPNARIKKDLVLVGGRYQAASGAIIGGDKVVVAFDPGWNWLRGTHRWIHQGLMMGRPLAHQSTGAWIWAGASLLFYLLVASFLPRPVSACVLALERRPVGSFFAGLLGFLLLGPIFLLLIVSVVGVIVIPFLLVALFAAFLFGKMAVYQSAGRQLGQQVRVHALQTPLLALLFGGLLFYLVYMVPVLGFVAWGLVATVAFGAVLVAMLGGLSAETVPVMVAGSALMGTAGVPGPGIDPAAPESASLRRAGFWIRLWATLLDGVLITAIAMLLNGPRFGLILWVLYHLVMWTWRGTTIGGVVAGLKILRKDGRPLTFPIALVRCLSAFFSGLVLLLGFFWAGWDKEKQSWHDKIAGTVVVRVPKGTSLI